LVGGGVNPADPTGTDWTELLDSGSSQIASFKICSQDAALVPNQAAAGQPYDVRPEHVTLSLDRLGAIPNETAGATEVCRARRPVFQKPLALSAKGAAAGN
jgi:hypothetical protein